MRIVAFILLSRCLTRYQSVITPILSNTFLIVWRGADNAFNPSCDSETVRQYISKTFVYCYSAYNIFKNYCLTVSLSHKRVAKRELSSFYPPLIHRLSTRWRGDYKGMAPRFFENKTKTAKLSLAVFLSSSISDIRYPISDIQYPISNHPTSSP